MILVLCVVILLQMIMVKVRQWRTGEDDIAYDNNEKADVSDDVTNDEDVMMSIMMSMMVLLMMKI